MTNRNEMIRFPGASGELLAARFDLPADTPRACALFAHCFTCSKDSLAASHIGEALTSHGIAVLRFDFTGLGGSGGDFANTNFSSNVADLLAAVDYLRTHHCAPSILIGHSLGGAAMLAAAQRVPEALAVATIAAPFDPRHVRRFFEPAAAELETRGEAEVTLGGRKFRIRRQLLEDLGQQNTQAAIRNLRKALLIFHSPRDTIVEIENAAEIYAAALHPKSFVSLADADHLLTRKSDAAYVAAVLAAWASRYLAASAPPATDAAALTGTVVVQEARTGKFTQEIAAGRHRLRADEPQAAGGDDTGPTPYDLLAGALGACTAMTIRLYAERKQIPLDRVTVRLAHAKIHAHDCAQCETKEGQIDRIEREIELTGALDSGQRAKLLEIADKCPVHRTLQSEIAIFTRLKN